MGGFGERPECRGWGLMTRYWNILPGLDSFSNTPTPALNAVKVTAILCYRFALMTIINKIVGVIM